MFPFKKYAAQQAEANQPLHNRLETIRRQLGQLHAQQPSAAAKVGGEGAATLGDDAPLPADKRAAIAQEEHIVRQALKAVGADYDALIATPGQEGKPSAYALAVQANPHVLQEVLAAEHPTLKALEVATAFKPYAEFAAKYGTEPAAIKAAMRAEVLAESAEGTEEQAAAPSGAVALPFSRKSGAKGNAAPKTAAGGLREVFNK